jgi:hypothetical protein
MGVVNERLPSRQRAAVDLGLFERIAEHAERIDRHVGAADRLFDVARKFRQVGVHRLPEERLDAFEAELDEFAHIAAGVFQAPADHGADANVFQGFH